MQLPENENLEVIKAIRGDLGCAKRQILAIMFSDIKGYSALMGQDEELAFELLDRHNQIVVPIIESYEGSILKFIGDAILASFESTVHAAKCAHAVQDKLFQYNTEQELSHQIWVRIGVHVGDVYMKNNDVFGDGVNVAARLEGMARPGGIVISSTVRDTIQASTKLELLPMGELNLKNIQYKVQGFEIVTPSMSSNLLGSNASNAAPIIKQRVLKLGSKKKGLLVGLFAIAFLLLTFQKPHESEQAITDTDSKMAYQTANLQKSSPEPRVNLNLQSAPAVLVFQMICKFGELDCMIDSDLSGKVSVSYEKAALSEVLEDLMSMNRYEITSNSRGRYIFQNAKP